TQTAFPTLDGSMRGSPIVRASLTQCYDTSGERFPTFIRASSGTTRTTHLRCRAVAPLDLILFSHERRAFGAHVASSSARTACSISRGAPELQQSGACARLPRLLRIASWSEERETVKYPCNIKGRSRTGS